MKYVELGRSGIKVSNIGLGIWQATKDWKGNDESIRKAIIRSHELGVNLIDTAEAYGSGHSEEVLGRALKELRRDEIVIATKVSGEHLRFDELQRACRASAARLGVSEIDVYQVHWPNPWAQIPLKETMRALQKLHTEGRIRAIGVSNFAVRDLEEARSLLSKTDIASNQVRYNMLQRDVEKEVIPYCKKEGISVMAYSPLAQGALTGKYNTSKTPKGDTRDSNPLFTPENLAQIERFISSITQIAQKHGNTVAQIALSWLTFNPIVIPIPGAKDVAQAKENVGAANIQLTREELSRINAALRKVRIDYFSRGWP